MKQTAVNWLENEFKEAHKMFGGIDTNWIKRFEQAKQMEKEQIKQSFVECWKANVPDGVECKLDAEQYYNETFKSE